jgi:GTP pyrophosphokinase/guanosine-3',5'-bis(diphosphate) 3'-pyrophosphohydrolase
LATPAEIKRLFGKNVARLVDGVTKLSKIEAQSESQRAAENLRKFLLAMSDDIRVLLVKLADRLHNMRTLHYLKDPDKRRRIARETMDIYAPLAERIGMYEFMTEMQTLAFRELEPDAYESIVKRLERLNQGGGGDLIQRIGRGLRAHLEAHGIEAEVHGREKHPYSIWRKLQRKSIGFSQLSDIYAFRVIVDTEDDCYRALGFIHRAWPSVPERFKDFISTPKRNNYRSLHTTVVGPKGMRIEMQIRTEAMDRVAEEGVAAHWRYKDKSYGFDVEHQKAAGGRDPLVNLRHLVQVLEHGGDAEELVEHAKLEMFLDQVFVFTPKGQLVSLPSGAMPLDFAYAVHTNIGDTTIGVKVNGELKPLRTTLQNGDVVEVIRGGKPIVPPDWRSLAVTGRARSAIRRHIRQTEKEEFTRLGRVTVEQAFEAAGKSLKEVSMRPALDRFAAPGLDELYESVGRGRVTPPQVLDAIFPGLKVTEREAASARHRIEAGKGARLYVRGGGLTPGIAIHFGECCSPVPGDRIVGILEGNGRGITVHTIDCDRLAEYEDREELWRDLQWTPEAERNAIARAKLTTTIRNAPGVLGQACTVIGEAGGNIVGLRMHHRQADFFDVDFDLEVSDARHLTHIAAALRANPSVETVDRTKT